MTPRSCAIAGTEGDSQRLTAAVALSALGHLIFFAGLIFLPDIGPVHRMAPDVINVTMVTLPAPGAPAARADTTPGAAPEPQKTTEKPKKAPVPVSPPKPPAPKTEKAVSLAPKKAKPKPKTSLKKKTFKPAKVVKRAINRIEKQVAADQQDPMRDTFSRLRKSVEKQAAAKPDKTDQRQQGAGGQLGLPGGSDNAGGRMAEAVEIYQMQIAIQIQQNWAFSEQLSGGSQDQQASLVFKVMPDGEIRDVFFTDRSGNRHLDESAYRAIVKSNPVQPHPPGIVAPYVQVGLRFTPKGIR